MKRRMVIGTLALAISLTLAACGGNTPQMTGQAPAARLAAPA